MRNKLNSNHFIFAQLLFLVLFFAVGKIVFAAYNSDIEAFSGSDIFNVIVHGFLLDVNTSALILLPAFLISTLIQLKKGKHHRAVLAPYYIFIGLFAAVVVAADCIMYEFWKFKLSAVVLSYAASPEGASSSVSTAFIATRAGSAILAVIILIAGLLKLTPKEIVYKKKTLIYCWLLFVLCLIPQPLKKAYFSDSITKNHATVNPVRNFLSSIRTGNYDTWYRYMDENDCATLVSHFYPTDTEDVTDTLLTTKRPNVLLIQWESLGSQFVKEMGGLDNVTPNVSRMIKEGIFWSEYYSSSFRTDRGTVSIYSGQLSYPDVGLMKEQKFHKKMSSIAHTLNKNGYSTTYLYPGAMTNMGKGIYLADMGFQNLLDNNYFTDEELDSPWGASDGNSSKKTLAWVKEHENDAKPWLMVYQTVSSHEPFDVPYERLEDKVQNAFAYTDDCIGKLIDGLKETKAWDNLLVILIPDHGYLYEQTLQDAEFFHSPMVWTGGAIKSPRTISTIMNQSDIVATLLSQMGISHKDFPWSRNVLSKNYKYPFAYCNYPAGFLFVDSTGKTMYDLMADVPTAEEGDGSSDRITKGQAILQMSHNKLMELAK